MAITTTYWPGYLGLASSSKDIATMPAAVFEIDFRNTGNSASVTSSGFSFPEPYGSWTDGADAMVELQRPPRHSRLELRLTLIPCLIAGHVSAQHLSMSANGRDIFRARITERSTIRVRLPDDICATSDRLSLSFKFPDALSPSSTSASQDPRVLGFMFLSLALVDLNSAISHTPPIPASGPVLHFAGDGQLGNLMIKYLVARALAARVPGLRISGLSLPDWGLDFPAIAQRGREHIVRDLHYFNVTEVAELINGGRIDRVTYRGYGQRFENFSAENHAALFQADIDDIEIFGADTLVIHIRGSDNLGGAHPDYPLLPVEFYRDIVRMTGLRPVFLGQLDANAYIDDLHAAFPDAVFLPPQDRMRDFETLRQAKSILISVSTFSWMAAWLSHAEQIYVPVSGFLHPIQRPDVDLLPKCDPRYRFFLFPLNFAVSLPDHRRVHAALNGLWREVTGDMLHHIAQGARLYPRRIDDYLAVFDSAFYLSAHEAVREAIAQGTAATPRDHYIRIGFDARLAAMPIDPRGYVSDHIMAAMEIGQGDFEGAEHHYVAVGRRRGYAVGRSPQQ